jgi:CheY-like chemotaxis protein
MKLPAAELVAEALQEPASSIEKETARLAGKRLLVMEDEALVALHIVTALKGAGAEVAGSAGTAKDALAIINNASLDAALLDANLSGDPVDEIAGALAAHNVPFLFVTGYGRESLPKAFGGSAMLSKPFGQEQLIAAVALLVQAPHAFNA